jgi:anaerobic dimethyl sulfoxide reductase subunit C (anchor subunit)
MRADDWSLILFTLLVQTMVGAMVTTVVVHWRISRGGQEETADRICNRLLPWLGGLLVVAATISLSHLGSPLRARYVLSNLASSWLSREVLLVGLVTGCGALHGLLQWRSWGTATVRRLLAWLTAALGVALVVTMSQVYMLATVPPWNRLATPLAFVSTAALLGVLTVTLLTIGYRSTEGDQVRRLLDRLPSLLLGLIGLRLVAILATALPVAGEQVPAPALTAMIMQAALLVIAASVLAAGRRVGIPAPLVAAVTVLVSGSELLGRILFFASYWRIGI